ILAHGRQVWHLVPGRHKFALGCAAVLMGLTSACNVAFPLLLGRMVDEVKVGTEQDLTAQRMYAVAVLYLGLIAGAYLLREALTKQPYLALAMSGVVPVSLFLTMRQLLSQKGVRLRLIRSREGMDGTVVELLGGMDYVRAANTLEYESKRVQKAAEARRAMENRHHFQMSLFGCAKALNEGFFHILVLGMAI